MSKKARVNQHQSARRAAERLREQERRRKQRIIWFSSAVAVVLIAVVALVVVKLAGGGSTKTNVSTGSTPAPVALTKEVTSVPPGVLDAVGTGTVDSLPTAITSQPALTSNGKPLVVYIGAEYCPFCAAQRWAVVVALSRFGTFANLGATHSSSVDVYPSTATLSFHGATYTSKYLDFQGVETESNVQTANGYATLDTPTAAQQNLLQTYNAPPYVPANEAGSIPFIDYGNRYISSGASYSPRLLAGLTGDQIAAALSNPDSPIAKAVNGSANAITAVLCQLTSNQPANVCSSSAATVYKGKL